MPSIYKIPLSVKSALDRLALSIGNGGFSYLPTDFELVNTLKKFAPQSEGIFLQYIDISNLYSLEDARGPHLFNQSVKIIAKTLQDKYVPELPSTLTFLEMKQLLTDDYVLFCALNTKLTTRDLYDLDSKIRFIINRQLEQEFSMLSSGALYIKTGHYVIEKELESNIVQALFKGLKNSCKNAKKQEKSFASSLIAHFEEIIASENISHLYQPIVSLKSGQILGWEALARGPANSYFHSPVILFSYALEIGSLLALENISQKKAIQCALELRPQQKLFVNINSQSITSLETFQENFLPLMQQKGLTPRNIVFEITERTSIHNFNKVKKMLSSLRSKGFSIAIDDAGAGYSSLQAIAELQPDYIKLDMSIVHNIDKDPVKEALVETFVTFAKKINASLIAEGIETKGELFTLINLGVGFGQGYLLGKPQYPMENLKSDILVSIRKYNRKSEEKLHHNTIPIGSIVQTVPLVDPHTPVEAVMEYFRRDLNLEGIVVAKEMVPLGLVMRHDLYNSLSSRYGVALYYKKPIQSVMDANPMIVEENLTLEKASLLAMARSSGNLYDHIIVIKNSVFAGIVSIRKLLEVITQTKIKMAQYANPLTGLPGNIKIQEEIVNVIKENKYVMVTYVDIDKFKAYNDTYGFEKGDEILLSFSKILQHVGKKYGSNGTFLGHIGGDDFILISDPSETDFLNIKIINIFNRIHKNSISASLASIFAVPGRFKNHLELGEYAARAKAEAKKTEGSTYLREKGPAQPLVFTRLIPGH